MAGHKKAVISVWDKTGIVGLARVLDRAGYTILSTSKTAEAIRSGRIPVSEISEFTGSPEILGGRVKTLHSKIASGILTTRHDSAVESIDIVVCNLYPFADGLKHGANHKELVELIDIGGVTLLRAAAKNYAFVTVVPDPEYYPRVISEIEEHGAVRLEFRLELACRAFQMTSRYDAAIARYFCSSKR